MKKAIIAGLGSVALALALASCGGEAEAPVDIAPEAPEGISVSDGRLNLPAVAGNPGAVYFTITNEGESDQMLRAADVPGAGNALFHETIDMGSTMDMQELLQVSVPAGESLVFEPSGKHIMIMDLAEGMEAGGEVEVTLSFIRGDKVSFPARVLEAGDDGSGE